MRRNGGFSLIEILAVLLILALVASMGAVTLRGQRGQATLKDVCERLADYDLRARTSARRTGEAMELVLAPDGMQQRMAGSRQQTLRMPLLLPDGFAIRESWLGGRRTAGETLAVQIGRDGRSRTYGFRLDAPQQQSRWFTIMGLSGQVEISQANVQADQVLSLLGRKGLDAP